MTKKWWTLGRRPAIAPRRPQTAKFPPAEAGETLSLSGQPRHVALIPAGVKIPSRPAGRIAPGKRAFSQSCFGAGICRDTLRMIPISMSCIIKAVPP